MGFRSRLEAGAGPSTRGGNAVSTSAPVRPSRVSRSDSSRRTSGANASTLAELEGARATVAFLRQRGDPIQFWEALLLARNRRAIPAPADGRPAAVAPEVEAALVQELGR